MTIVNTILYSTLKLNLESTRHVVLIRNVEQNEIIVFQNGLWKTMVQFFKHKRRAKKDDKKVISNVHE